MRRERQLILKAVLASFRAIHGKDLHSSTHSKSEILTSTESRWYAHDANPVGKGTWFADVFAFPLCKELLPDMDFRL